MLYMIGFAHFRAQNRDYTFVENALGILRKKKEHQKQADQ